MKSAILVGALGVLFTAGALATTTTSPSCLTKSSTACITEAAMYDDTAPSIAAAGSTVTLVHKVIDASTSEALPLFFHASGAPAVASYNAAVHSENVTRKAVRSGAAHQQFMIHEAQEQRQGEENDQGLNDVSDF